MSKEAAEAFFDRAESDAAFREELEELMGDNQAVYQHVVDAGFDVEPDEVMKAFTDRYGVKLTPEQLGAVTAGDDTV
jgi:predicted ribosomally synthesized peptide with nif11-like leader